MVSRHHAAPFSLWEARLRARLSRQFCRQLGVVTLQQANAATAQQADRYAGRVADPLEQSGGLAEARPADCRVGGRLEAAESHQRLRPCVCRLRLIPDLPGSAKAAFNRAVRCCIGVDAQEPVVVEFDRKTLRAFGIPPRPGRLEQCRIDVGEVGHQRVGPRGVRRGIGGGGRVVSNKPRK